MFYEDVRRYPLPGSLDVGDLGNLLLDFRGDPSVRQALAREKRDNRLYVALGILSASALVLMTLTGGLTAFSWVLLAAAALVLFFVASSTVSLVDFDSTFPGLRVFELGLALPWRSREIVARGDENVALFRDIREIRVVSGKGGADLIVVWKEDRRPRSFLIESKWVPDARALLRVLDEKVPIREL